MRQRKKIQRLKGEIAGVGQRYEGGYRDSGGQGGHGYGYSGEGHVMGELYAVPAQAEMSNNRAEMRSELAES
jgi:hypothetical protein